MPTNPVIVTPVGRHLSAAAHVEDVAAPIAADAAAEALKRGPVGALVLSAIAVAILFIGWLLFYFLLFLGRGPLG